MRISDWSSDVCSSDLYRGVERRPGRDAGNVSIYRHDHGWAWLIPLADGDMSVGAVCYPEYLKTRKGDSEGFLLRTLDTIPEVKRRMEGAQRVAPVHVTGNYARSEEHTSELQSLMRKSY